MKRAEEEGVERAVPRLSAGRTWRANSRQHTVQQTKKKDIKKAGLAQSGSPETEDSYTVPLGCHKPPSRTPRTSSTARRSSRNGHISVNSVSCGSLNQLDTGTALFGWKI